MNRRDVLAAGLGSLSTTLLASRWARAQGRYSDRPMERIRGTNAP